MAWLAPRPGQAYLGHMYTVAALYHFTRFDDPAALQRPLLDLCKSSGIMGTLLLAKEGINGTIAGDRAGIDAVLAHVRALPGMEGKHGERCAVSPHESSAEKRDCHHGSA